MLANYVPFQIRLCASLPHDGASVHHVVCATNSLPYPANLHQPFDQPPDFFKSANAAGMLSDGNMEKKITLWRTARQYRPLALHCI